MTRGSSINLVMKPFDALQNEFSSHVARGRGYVKLYAIDITLRLGYRRIRPVYLESILITQFSPLAYSFCLHI